MYLLAKEAGRKPSGVRISPSPSMKFILTRHTTTDWNIIGKQQGWTDIPLNERGKAEAHVLAQKFVGLDIDAIVCSDLKRTSETAEIINTVLALPLHRDARLRECCFGEIQGLTQQESIEKYGPTLAHMWANEATAYDFRPYGGESRDQVLARHKEVLNMLVRENPGKTMLLVGHDLGLLTLLTGLGYDSGVRVGDYRVLEYNV